MISTFFEKYPWHRLQQRPLGAMFFNSLGKQILSTAYLENKAHPCFSKSALSKLSKNHHLIRDASYQASRGSLQGSLQIPGTDCWKIGSQPIPLLFRLHTLNEAHEPYSLSDSIFNYFLFGTSRKISILKCPESTTYRL